VSMIDSLREHALFGLELLGAAAFAVSGVLSAVRKKMDVVGICACGFLAAFGGGTLRDVLLDRRPFFWVEHQSVLLMTLLLCVGCATVLNRSHLEKSQRVLQVPDAIGLGLFCASGLHLSWSMGQPPLVAIMMGVVTGTFGGVLRDMACNEMPRLFSDHPVCRLCAGWRSELCRACVAGGARVVVYVGLRWGDFGLAADGALAGLGVAGCQGRGPQLTLG